MNIKNYISKDLVIGAIGGSILATIITSIIDTKAVNKVEEELEISKDELEKAAEKMNDQDEVVKAQGTKIQELEDELDKYDDDEFKKWNQFRSEFSDFLKEKREKEQKEESEEKVKKAIKNKEWNEVYRLTERWYNHYPVQMSRSEVFTNLEKDEYITQEEYTEAYNYFGSLWNYVGD